MLGMAFEIALLAAPAVAGTISLEITAMPEVRDGSLVVSLEAGGDAWGMLTRGRAEQLELFGSHLEIYRGSVKPELVAEYERLLGRLREL